MRILADRFSDRILQVEKVPEEGQNVPVNGKYVLPTPEGVSLHVEPDSFILPVSDPNSVVAQAYAGLLARHPMYETVLYNPLLQDSDIDDLDLSATFQDPETGDVFSSRVQTGRGTGGPLASGQAPNNTALLPANSGVSPARPGLLVSDTIDLRPYTLDPMGVPVGANDFLVYWYVYNASTTDDVRSSFGLFANENRPALRQISERTQEPADLQVYLSLNDGATWTEVQRLTPISFCNRGNDVRLAFRNNGTSKLYLAAYAILF